MEPDRWPVARLVADLGRLGVAGGDLLMVHASLRALGPVEGGADGVLEALAAAVGPGGTLLMTLGARDDHAWVNERPEAERPGLLAGAEPFDHLVTPADPDVGVLAEVFRNRPGTVVSDHPEGRFGASGRLARQLVEDVAWDDYHGAGSPLERFVQAGGRVVRLGADLDTLDDCGGIVEHPGEDYFAVILRQYLATGRAATGVVGGAVSELIDAADVVGFGVAWMAEHLVPAPGYVEVVTELDVRETS